MLRKIKKAINILFHQKIRQRNRRRLRNQNFSVLSANCNGAFILHDLGQRFNSPFVNLYFSPKDFIRYLQRLDHYMHQELQFIASEKNYPVAKLDDLTIHFMHYHSEQQAREKWHTRSQRINLDNIFILMTEIGDCTEQDLLAFDQLPFKNKVVLTHKPYPHIQSAFYIKGFEHQTNLGDLYLFSGWNGKTYYDQFDYVAWFNGETNKGKI